MVRWKRLVAALIAVFALLTLTATTSAAAKTKACKKGYVRNKAKKCVRKAAATTKRPTTTLARGARQIQAPAGSTATTLKPRPTDVNPDGELVMSYAAAPNSLDPARNSLATFTYLLYDRLTTIDDSLNVRPMLATGWTFPNKSTFEMTLRNDVTFEDGTKFDAAAVKANIERSKTLGGTNLNAPLLRNVASVEVVSPTVVRFRLSAGGTELPALFAQSPGMMISPKVIASGVSLDTGTHGGGSGPYTVDSITIGDRVSVKQSRMVLDGTYWDKAAGQLKKLTWIYLPTSPQRINAVRSGDIDVGQITGVDTYPAQQMVDKGELKGRHVTLQTTQVAMMMRNTRGPLANLQFRQALQYAVDKAGLSKGLYNGDCTPASQFFTSAHWAHSATVDKRYRYDPELAQKMIKDTGIFNPTFTIQALPLYQAPAQALQGILGDYGINVKLETQATTDTSFRDGNFDANVGTMSGQVDPTNIINSFFLPTGIYKLYTDTDGSVTRDAAAASDPTISQAAAAKLFDGIWQKIAEQAVTLPLCNSHQVWLHKGKVANINDLGYTFSGLVDSRYLYVRK